MSVPSPEDQPPVPAHVAIIMDGNGRWAKQRGLPRIEGHRRGVKSVRQITAASRELGIRTLTLYAFSVENWNRPGDEVGALMRLLEFFLKRETRNLVRDKVRLRTIGRTDQLPERVRRQLNAALAATAGFDELTLVLALNYGARTEVAEAAHAYATDLAAGKIPADTPPSWQTFSSYLYTCDMPDPDLVIRTSGETRISNFLLMQAAYAEFVFTPVLWPDFSKDDLIAAVRDYQRRERRFGRTSDQIKPAAKA